MVAVRPRRGQATEGIVARSVRRPHAWTRTYVLLVSLAAAGGPGCGELGYTDRVLWRVPSPDGKVIAVCQETPELDGPGYDLRLESPEGARIAQLYHIGDGDPCNELAWAPDGKVLAVLSRTSPGFDSSILRRCCANRQLESSTGRGRSTYRLKSTCVKVGAFDSSDR
jgi:hypothetical protein